MPDLATPLPCRRPELVVRPLGENGPYVVKEPGTGAYFQVGQEEHFLLAQLDRPCDGDAVRAAFAERFGQPLSDDELKEFVEMAQARGLLEENGHQVERRQVELAGDASSPGSQAPYGLRILYWRKNFFDPDRLFTWLEPKIWFFWTPAFLVLSALLIVLATVVLWLNRHEAAHSFVSALRWETAVLAWLVLMLVITCHEFAHGLTCKHHGGEVHEVGFLLIFFMPCFYCNVSDAWLFKEKSKRLWVTFAGGYFELFLWALAVFVWRLTVPDSLANYLAFVVLSACGVQTLFNFNPLIKLDGYYLLSDWLELPNLLQRGSAHFKRHVRHWLWGAPKPDAEPHGRALLNYGLISWLYSVFFLCLMVGALFLFLWRDWGWLGAIAAALLWSLSLRGLFKGFTAGEVRAMITQRRKRTVFWVLGLSSLAAIVGLVEIEDRASGSFRLRPATRAELRAPVAGFLTQIDCDEGDRVSPGAQVARLEVPDLESRIAQKYAEINECKCKLRLLVIGPRPEEIAEQRRRVEQAAAWLDLAQSDLKRTRQALEEDLERLEKQVEACKAEQAIALDGFQRSKALAARQALTDEQFREAEGKLQVSRARLSEAEAAKRVTRAKGTLEAEAELARRAKELADARGALRLLEAGSRPEEIDAERARLARLEEEIRHCEELRQKQAVGTPVAGLVTTPRLKEKAGQYLREGELICVVEEAGSLEAEIALAEQDVSRIRPGQKVRLKARALPFQTFSTRVERIAPAAGRGEVQSSVTVYCRLDHAPAPLRSEMTGQARIDTGRRSIGRILLDRALRLVRTEFWW